MVVLKNIFHTLLIWNLFGSQGKSGMDFFKAADTDGSDCLNFDEVVNWFHSNPPDNLKEIISNPGDGTFKKHPFLEMMALKMGVKGVILGKYLLLKFLSK